MVAKNFSSRMHFIETNLVDNDRSENPGMMVDRNNGSQEWKPLGSNHSCFSTISGTATSTLILKKTVHALKGAWKLRFRN